MFDDVASIFYNSVIPAYEDYVAHRDGSSAGRDRHLRSAVETATALFHFREHLPAHQRMSRAQVETECPDFQLIADVANATKHGQLTKGAPIVKSAEDVRECVIITTYNDAEGEYSDARTVVEAQCVDGSTRNLDLALASVLNFWGNKLKIWGIANYVPQPTPEVPGARYIGRDKTSRIDLELLKGIRFQQRSKFLKFNREKGYAEPIDLTGKDLKFSIYEPKYELKLAFKKDGIKKKIEIPLSLSEKESIHLHRLHSEKDKQNYLRELLEVHREEIETEASAALSEMVGSDENNV